MGLTRRFGEQSIAVDMYDVDRLDDGRDLTNDSGGAEETVYLDGAEHAGRGPSGNPAHWTGEITGPWRARCVSDIQWFVSSFNGPSAQMKREKRVRRLVGRQVRSDVANSHQR